nr:MAG TPA: hypothetical protein [Caudoviricetes sp.]
MRKLGYHSVLKSERPSEIFFRRPFTSLIFYLSDCSHTFCR